MADPGNASQPTGNTGIGAATATGFGSDLAGFETPRVTPELQSGSEPLPEPNSTSDLPHEIPLLGVAGVRDSNFQQAI